MTFPVRMDSEPYRSNVLYGSPVGKRFRLPVTSSALPALFPYHFSTLSHAHVQNLTHGTSLWHRYLHWKTRAHMTVFHMHASKYSHPTWRLNYSSVQIIVHKLSLVFRAFMTQWKIFCVFVNFAVNLFLIPAHFFWRHMIYNINIKILKAFYILVHSTSLIIFPLIYLTIIFTQFIYYSWPR